MLSHTIRHKFLQYFKEKGHMIVPSSPVIPHDDPTLLFINAGMNQFKDVFLGKSKRDYTKATSSQKCIRAGGKHNDLENVGHTSRHLTFFEMLGNFSFGDYFKKEAISFAWDVTTKVFEFDPAFLYATVFLEDDESFELWKQYLPDNRIVRLGEKDNFWAMGDTGPCGPCTELLFDRGHTFGSARNPTEDTSGERFFEFWNIVFMEFNRKSPTELLRLPKQSVDTGAGLERVVSLKMGVRSLFETDIFKELIAETEKVFHVTYKKDDVKQAPAFHVIADHLRTLSFAIADGAQPSNIERGYVLRKILRRAVRYGRLLGRDTPFLAKILPRLVDVMGEDYPELKHAQERIAEIVTLEEESFFRTLRRGGQLLNNVISLAITHKNEISAEDAFKLKDTYGLPLDEIQLLAKDANLSVDIAGFAALENEAKERSRKTKKEVSDTVSDTLFENHLEKHGATHFLGYHELKARAVITALMKGGEFVEELLAGDEGAVLLDRTPFYAEKGGQISDQGVLESKNTHFIVEEAQAPYTDVVIHKGVLREGILRVGETIQATVEEKRRQKIANNHTATHLLHFALQKVLGQQVKQAGSIVEAQRLRFDFSHHKALTKEELSTILDLVNEMIRANIPVNTYELKLEEAVKRTEIKQFFGEKYGKSVRVVDISESKELCGGTHTTSTGNIGLFKIVKEMSISAGVRRIEAVTGLEAEEIIKTNDELLSSLAASLKVQPGQLVERMLKLLDDNKALTIELSELRKKMLSFEVDHLLQSAQKMNGVVVLIKEVACDPKELKTFSDLLMEKSPHLALALFTKAGDSCSFILRLSPELTKKGLQANEWLKEIASIVGGKGGGKNEMAIGGGTLPNKIPEALTAAQKWIENFFKNL